MSSKYCSFKNVCYVFVDVSLSCLACFFLMTYLFDVGMAVNQGEVHTLFADFLMTVLSCWILASKSVLSCFTFLTIFLADLFLAVLTIASHGDRMRSPGYNTPWVVSPSLLDEIIKSIMKTEKINSVDLFPAKFLPTLVLAVWMSIFSLLLQSMKSDKREISIGNQRVLIAPHGHPVQQSIQAGGDGVV